MMLTSNEEAQWVAFKYGALITFLIMFIVLVALAHLQNRGWQREAVEHGKAEWIIKDHVKTWQWKQTNEFEKREEGNE